MSNNVILPHIRSDIFIVWCYTHVNTIVEDVCNQTNFFIRCTYHNERNKQCDGKFYKERWFW